MTTIAYDHKAGQIAIDGRTAAGNTILSNSDIKWRKDGEDYWFLCGSVCDEDRFVDHLKASEPENPKWPIEASAFFVSGGKVYQCVVCEDGAPAKSLLTYSDTMGSGGVFAMAAMDHGKTAKEAVEYAATRDTGTGGKVSIFDVGRMEFIE